MRFETALDAMKAGAKVKRPSWAGYWSWDEKTLTRGKNRCRVKQKHRPKMVINGKFLDSFPLLMYYSIKISYQRGCVRAMFGAGASSLLSAESHYFCDTLDNIHNIDIFQSAPSHSFIYHFQ